MEVVVLNSEIARLVFGYLKSQRLERASQVFCKTSPYLLQEFCAFEQGLQTYSFLPQLEEIIREFVKIKSSVENTVASLPESAQLYPKNLSDKIIYLLERVQTDERNGFKDDAARATSTTSQSNRENSTHKSGPKRKLKRKLESLVYSSDEQRKCCVHSRGVKRRRVIEPFCFLSTKTTNLSQQVKLTTSYSTLDDDGSEEDSDSGKICIENANVAKEEREDEEEEDFRIRVKPTKESTPRSNILKTKNTTLSLPEISQVILDNQEFQKKLVENINQALNCSIPNDNQNIQDHATQVDDTTTASEQKILSTNQLLDQMVLDILDATANDPTFDKIVEEVVGSSKKNISTGVQCNLEAAAECAIVPEGNAESGPSTTTTTIPPPRTPMFLRTAMATTTATSTADQDLAHLPNTSFGSLIDPNFSISKLIVLNANDSAQKQSTDQSVDNATTDQIVNQLSTSHDYHLDDQICFDAATGQLTFPVFLTNDGLLTNFPFLVNSDVVQQQLLPENLANLDVPRLEIPLVEPIVVSANQLPSSAVVLARSNHKENNDDDDEVPAPVPVQPPAQHTAKKVASKCAEDDAQEQQQRGAVAPSSLDSRIMLERATPSTSGIVNNKTFRSLSTPRRRASHVRALTFSPSSSAGPLSLAGATPLSTRHKSMGKVRPVSIVKAKPAAVANKPIINKVEILPSLPAATHPVLDASNNDSSNSCSIPQFFAGDETSNQTVIKRETVEPPQLHASESNTPKRKQLRHNAVRACKRQLSKSSIENDADNNPRSEATAKKTTLKTNACKKQHVPKSTSTAATAAEVALQTSPVEKPDESIIEASQEDEPEPEAKEFVKRVVSDRMMDEWQRIRNSTTHDLDSRLREINSQMANTRPTRRLIKRKSRRKNLLSLKAKQAKARKKRNGNVSVNDSEANLSLDDTAALDASMESVNIDNSQVECGVADAKATMDEMDAKKLVTTTSKAEANCKEFSVKIVTPQKFSAERVSVRKRDDESAKVKSDLSSPLKPPAGKDDNRALNCQAEAAGADADPAAVELCREANERVKRSANIACLLETPFKEDANQSQTMPPTPGILAPSMDTPMSKLCDDTLRSASFLFGSLTKSELGTPTLNAITPGLRFTPFTVKDSTPRSAVTTEYSSGGGSYYKPDESDNLDRNIDKLLRDSAQKKHADEGQQTATPELTNLQLQEHENRAMHDAGGRTSTEICVEIPVETLKVEPIVMKRVKSFASENGDTEKLEHIDPHYTLVSGLPDVSAEEAESTSSSSSSSSSSSCSSSSSSSSGSPSSTSSRTLARPSPDGEKVLDQAPPAPPRQQSIENLSEISSTEDGEWARAALPAAADNAQLVNIDGEVRYPVRSWLTPCKEQAVCGSTVPPATIKVLLPLKSAARPDNQQASEDLEKKRLRMKEKLRIDSEPKGAKVPHVTRSKKLKASTLEPTRRAAKPGTAAAHSPTAAGEAQKSFDVLTALQLSARKKEPGFMSSSSSSAPTVQRMPTQVPLPGAIDDNAVSTVFNSARSLTNVTATAAKANAQRRQPTTATNASSAAMPKAWTSLKTPSNTQRKCQHVEAHAVPTGGKRKAGSKQQKIDALAEKSSTLSKKLNVMPKIQVKTAAKGSSSTVENKRVSPRLRATQKPHKEKLLKNADGKMAKKSMLDKKCSGTMKKTAARPGRPSKKLKAAEALVDLAHTATFADNHNQETTAQNSTPTHTHTESNRDMEGLGMAAGAPKITAKIRIKPEMSPVSATLKPTTTSTVVNNDQRSDTIALSPSEPSAPIQSPRTVTAPTHAPVYSVAIDEHVADNGDNDVNADKVGDAVEAEIGIAEMDIEDIEEEELISFQLKSIAENDLNHCVAYVYNETDCTAAQSQTVENTKTDLDEFRMVVAFEDGEEHNLCFTDDFCLYTSKPKVNKIANVTLEPVQPMPIRNIPKKRIVRIVSDNDATSATQQHSQPMATSTPLGKSPMLNDGQHSIAKTSSATTPLDHMLQQTTTTATTNSPEKIQIEDIESILSHLHPTK